MITKQDVLDRAGEWQLRPEIVEKDYVLGWILAAIASHPETKNLWIFKGGTCLKKCYFETYRFSEDLDFSLLPDAIYTRDDLERTLGEVAASAGDASGITFPVDTISVRERKDRLGRITFEGKLGYRGPLAIPSTPRILFDLTAHEPVIAGIERRSIFHPYPDGLFESATVASYSLAELFAEKTRALLERTRPRDLYDVVFILENQPEIIDLARARDLFAEKCRVKSLTPPSPAALVDVVRSAAELRSEWSNMLAHQLPALPPLDAMLERLSALLAWIERPAPLPVAALARFAAPADETVIAPAGVALWQTGVPLEIVRFAGANHLLIEFTYHGRSRRAEPYSLRRARTGNLLLYAWEQSSPTIKAFKVTEMHSLQATDISFLPRYRIEFTSTGPLPISPAAVRPASTAHPAARPRGRPHRPLASYAGPVYVFQCSTCLKEFRHRKNDSRLRRHKAPHGYGHCPGRRGYLVRME